MKRLLVLPVILAMVVTIAPGALAARRHRAIVVDDNCNAVQNGRARHPFCTISAAVAAAAPGDTIRVRPGVYNETVQVGIPSLKIVGPQAAHNGNRHVVPSREAIVQGAGGGFALSGDRDLVAGFTVKDAANGAFNSGIHTASSASGYRILNNIVTNNAIGIFLDSAGTITSLVRGNRIQSNNATLGDAVPASDAGSGLVSDTLSNAVITRNSFVGNEGAGLLFEGVVGPVTHTHVTVTRNTSENDNAFQFYVTSDSTISRNVLKNASNLNSDFSGSGLFFGYGNSNLNVTRNKIYAAHLFGIRFNAQTATINTNNTVSRNTIYDALLDGIGFAPNSFTSGTVTGNRVDRSGQDGIHVEAGLLNVGNTFSRNTITRSGLSGPGFFDIHDETTGTGSGTPPTGNTYTANRCRTSSPAGLCA